MPCCGGGGKGNDAESSRSQELDSELEDDRQKKGQVVKLLLLGPGESGKSTLFKQFKIIHKNGFSAEELDSYKSTIHSNVITNMKTLLEGCDTLKLDISDENGKHREVVEAVDEMGGYELDENDVEAVKALWGDESIQETYRKRNQFQLQESARYFFDIIDRVSAPDYSPTQDDALRARIRTTGIVEMNFEVDDYQFTVYDVGGQRNERRKWIHCFENVTAVLFVVGLSEYDQMLYEDETQNRMNEALLLFDDICNSRWFVHSSMILFLNKKDLFAEKIKKVSLKTCFPDYDGGNDYENGVKFIKTKFSDLNKSDIKPIFVHETCATDSDQVEIVFRAVQSTIIDQNLRRLGVM